MKYETTCHANLEELISAAHEFAICIENQAQALFENAFELRLSGLLNEARQAPDRKTQQKAAFDWVVNHYDAASSCVYTALVLSRHIQELLEYIDRAVCEEA